MHPNALIAGDKAIKNVATERGLNAKYLGILWSTLNDSKPSIILDQLRSRWRDANPEDAKALAADVARWQQGLWTFNPVGLDAIEEGERTALDNSMLMMCSSMMSGIHDATKLPVVLVGRAGGQLETGRALEYGGKPNRKMCSLFLSVMDKCGVHREQFGDSNQRLAGV